MLQYILFLFLLLFIIIINIKNAESFNNDKNVHFITYGDDNFKKSKERIINEAKDSGFFTSTIAYGPDDLSSEFVEKYKDILKENRGGGYWIWKYDIIPRKLKEIPENDYLVYCDAGCTINKEGENRFQEYLQMIDKSKYDIISFQMKHFLEKHWTTKELFKACGVTYNNNIKNSGIYVGGILIMKNTPKIHKLYNECLKILEKDKNLIKDKYNNNNQISEFKENRHDQSLLSIMRKKHGSIILPHEPEYIFEEEHIKEKLLNTKLIPILATRIK